MTTTAKITIGTGMPRTRPVENHESPGAVTGSGDALVSSKATPFAMVIVASVTMKGCRFEKDTPIPFTTPKNTPVINAATRTAGSPHA
jgi:hypothetical protein